ncbi:MAG: IPT/TIG domain-containing protein [Prevotellaceae bacterium]|jgi:hypothetical protein|nr:IPT/TIG domain-containing protein [Prevotellaceae bacterium]
MNKLSKISVLFAAVIAIMLVSCKPDEPEISITITSVAPAKVVAGDVITVTGTNFDKITEATFGTVKVAKTAITFVSSEEIKLAVPANVTFPSKFSLFVNSQEVVWNGELTTTDHSQDSKYPYEPTTPSTLNFTYTSMATGSKNYGDVYGRGADIVQLVFNSSQGMAAFNLVMPTGTFYLYPATYPIVPIVVYGDIVAGKMWASPGFNASANFPDPSYVTKPSGNGVIPYYLVSGNMTITSTGFTVNATSYYGSTINFTYTGSLMIPQ